MGECVLTECGGMFFAVGFLADDEGVPITARCCDVGHASESDVDACWSRRAKERETEANPPPPPALVSTSVSLCVTHQATDHDDGRAWTDCRFRQLFYFENSMDEHTLLWSDEIGNPASSDSSSPGASEADTPSHIGPDEVGG